jgi:adapter protein MecA 1/2
VIKKNGVKLMKLERLSENQIRCTLYKADLADKQMLLNELAYGTDKAKELFKDLMHQASEELGFEAENIPLMIEAIPVSQDCLVLIITKVEDPEELDTRFSRFTKPIVQEDDDEDFEEFDDMEELPFGEELEETPEQYRNSKLSQLLETIGDLAGGIMNAANQVNAGAPAGTNDEKIEIKSKDIFRVYAFKKLDDVIVSAKLVDNIYKSDNTLYKNPQDSRFYLYMSKDKNTDTDFVKCCNMISEYGSKVRTTYSTRTHMDEHFKVIIDSTALQTLAKL